MELYAWYVVIAVGYIILSLVMLALNKKWDWVYGIILMDIIRELAPSLRDPIEADNLENDPGLVFVLVVLGPILSLIIVATAVVLATVAIAVAIAIVVMVLVCALFFDITVIFPRWSINHAVRK